MISFVNQAPTLLNLDRICTFKSLLWAKCTHLVRGKSIGAGKRLHRGPLREPGLLFGEQKSMGAVLWLRIATNCAIDTFEGSMFHFLQATLAFYHHIIPGLCGFGASTLGSCLQQKSLNYLLIVLIWNYLADFLFSDSCSTCFIELTGRKPHLRK